MSFPNVVDNSCPLLSRTIVVHNLKMSDFHQFKLRMPTELYKLLQQASKASGLSLSGEIIERLYASFSSLEEVMFGNRITELHVSKRILNELQHRFDGAAERSDSREVAALTKELNAVKRKHDALLEEINQLGMAVGKADLARK